MANFLRNLTFGKAILGGLFLLGVYYTALYESGEKEKADIEKQKGEVEKLKGEIAQISKSIEEAKDIEVRKAQLGSELGRITTAIPQNYTGVDLMKLVSQVAKDVGANINKINEIAGKGEKRAKDAPPEIYIPVMVQVQIGGTYNQVMTFLSSLTKTDKLLTTKTLKLDQTAKDPAIPYVTLNAVISGYRYVEMPKVEKVDKKAKTKKAPKKPAKGAQ